MLIINTWYDQHDIAIVQIVVMGLVFVHTNSCSPLVFTAARTGVVGQLGFLALGAHHQLRTSGFFMRSALVAL